MRVRWPSLEGPQRPLALLLCVLLTASCSARFHQPELGALYSRAAQAHGPERNPIIVIPGILGTRLKDSDTGIPVWGSFGGGYANPKKPEGRRLVALPMREGTALRDLHDQVIT